MADFIDGPSKADAINGMVRVELSRSSLDGFGAVPVTEIALTPHAALALCKAVYPVAMQMLTSEVGGEVVDLRRQG